MHTTIDYFSGRALFTTHEAARYLGVTMAKLRNSRYTGELYKNVPTPRYHKVGRSVMYRKATLDAWLASLPEFASTADYRCRSEEIV